MIYTGHLPASGDSFCVSVGAIVQRPSPYVRPGLAACLFGKFVALDRRQFAAQLRP